jgi:hypothetical protein
MRRGNRIQFEERWYLAYQDGRIDNKEYLTKEEAEKALKKLGDFTRMGVCIMVYPKRIE